MAESQPSDQLEDETEQNLNGVQRAILKLNSVEDVLTSDHNDQMAERAALEMVRAARDELEEVQ